MYKKEDMPQPRKTATFFREYQEKSEMIEKDALKAESDKKKIQSIETKLNNGYQWDLDRNYGIRNTEDKISLKF